MYIETVAGLTQLVTQLQGAAAIAIDTEFVRERQYYPQLEIVQVATEEIAAIIDYRAIGTLTPFQPILDDPRILKVFHAASQDLEIFLNLTGAVPTPLFDTQVAAAMVGLGAQIGYSRLVETVLGVVLLKSETLTDWSRRPLTQAQREYALDDVRYLLPVFTHLRERLQAMGRTEWVHEEWQAMSDPNAYRRVNPRDAFRRIGGANRLRPAQLAVLRELADWREREALRRDRAAPLVMKDAILLELARRTPQTLAEMREIRSIQGREIERYGEPMLAAIGRGKATPRADWPQLLERTALSGAETSLVALLQAWLKARAETLDIAPNYLATSAELQELVTATPEERQASPLLKGWRRRLIGKEVIALVEGRAALGWDANTRRLTLIFSS